MRQKLITNIIKESESDDIKTATQEWNYNNFYYRDNHCICGQKIKENIELVNKQNGNIIIVGTNCLTKLDIQLKNEHNIDVGILTENYFKIKKKIYSIIKKDLLDIIYENGILNDGEYKKYNHELETINPDFNFRKKINTKIINWLENKPQEEKKVNKTNFIFNFGKYKGKTYPEVLKEDEKYIIWFEENIGID